MFNEKEIEALRSEVADLRTLLQQSEEKRNAQYTDIMLAIRDIRDVVGSLDYNDDWESAESDNLYECAKAFVIHMQKASTSLLQRRFKLGYTRAAHIMDLLEENGVISESDGTNSPRKVLETSYEWQEEKLTADELDEHYDDVVALARQEGKISVGLIQRRFRIGYGRAARILDQLEESRVVGPSDGRSASRRVLGPDE